MLVNSESSFHQNLVPQNCMRLCVIDLETKSQKIGDFYTSNLFKSKVIRLDCCDRTYAKYVLML